MCFTSHVMKRFSGPSLLQATLRSRVASLLIGLIASPFLYAHAVAKEGYDCRLNGKSLFVSIEIGNEDGGSSCEVALWSDDESRQTLWTAKNLPETCRVRAHRFKSLLESKTWACSFTRVADENVRQTEQAGDQTPALPTISSRTTKATTDEPEPLTGLIRETSYLCERDDLRREVWIENDPAQDGGPCQVWRDGDLIGEKLIWQSKLQVNSCLAKAVGLMSSWHEQGWQCHADRPSRPFLDANRTAASSDVGSHGRGGAERSTDERKMEPSITSNTPTEKAGAIEDRASGEEDQKQRLSAAIERLKRNATGSGILENGIHDMAWIGDNKALRSRLTSDLARLSRAYDGEFAVRGGLFEATDEDSEAAAIALLSYRDVADDVHFVLNVYKREGDGYRMIDSIIAGRNGQF